MSIIEVKNICKSFGSHEVLKGISFSLEKGEVLSIIGSSGSGKTTFLRCLNFLETPDSGQIVVNGDVVFDSNDKTNYSDEQIRQKRLHFGLVFQSFNLFPQYNVLKNLTLAPELFEKSLKRKPDMEKIEGKALELLEMVGLTEKKDFYPYQLSGGQQQRVAIARALAMKPDILCFDEPTSALDPELTGEVLNVIKGLKGSDRTMIIVTHEMDFAKNVSDKVMFMANGVVEEFGTPQEIFDNPKSELIKSFIGKINEY